METQQKESSSSQNSGDRDKKKVSHINMFDGEVASLLQGLKLSSCQPDYDLLVDMEEPDKHLSAWQKASDAQMIYTVSDKMMCSLCDSKFDNREQQKEHYKLDWHRFNLKQRIMGAAAVTIDTFEAMSGDISSISGSDSNTSDSETEDHLSPYSDPSKIGIEHKQKQNKSDDDDDKGKMKQRSYPKVFFTNSQGQLISVHRCILHGKKNVPSSQSELTSMAAKLLQKPKWAIIMTGGGHFAGAVFHGSEAVVHKTFHRYTVRAKRGTAQGMRDGQQGGKAPKSAGASIRRYNEAALMQEIQDLLESWKDNLTDCQHIFLRAPTYNRNIFFGGKKPAFSKRDVRISSIPFPTRRATLKELKRIHDVLSSVECYGEAKEAEERLNSRFAAKSGPKSPKKKPGDKPVVKESNTKKKSKVKDSDKQPELIAEFAVEESDDDDDIDINLVYEEQEISTLHLKEFECTKKPRRRKKKPKAKLNGFEGDQLTNDLYTACKTGNTTNLETLLNEIAQLRVTEEENIMTKVIDQEMPVSREQINQNSALTELENKNEDRTNLKSDQDITNMNQNIAVETMLPNPDRLNAAIDDKGSTLLHVTAESSQKAVLWLLLESGADPSVRNKKGQPPYVVSANRDIRNEFRRFMAAYPDKYDYVTAQVPSPLTADMEEVRANKVNEKKKAQRKAKQAKLKERNEEQKKKLAETKEKAWFSGLSDREKRALAAENRMAKLTTNTEANKCRCWLCAEDMTGKVPFEYMDFKFCSMKCLKQHKQQQQNASR